MPPRVAPPKRSTRRIIEDDDSEGEDAQDGLYYIEKQTDFHMTF